jgi:hypothetical protein
MTEWKWEDAASRSPSCSVENPQENIASTSVEYIKAEPSHSHTRIFADGLEIQTENRAPTLAPSSRRGNGYRTTACRVASVVRKSCERKRPGSRLIRLDFCRRANVRVLIQTF